MSSFQRDDLYRADERIGLGSEELHSPSERRAATVAEVQMAREDGQPTSHDSRFAPPFTKQSYNPLMKAPWKLPLALVIATAIVTGFFYFATQEPQFEFVSQLDGKVLDNPLKGDWKVLNELKNPRVFYGFGQTEEEVLAAMRRELKPPKWTVLSDHSFVDEKTGVHLMSIRMPARDMPEGIRTIVNISRGMNLVESIRWKLFGTLP